MFKGRTFKPLDLNKLLIQRLRNMSVNWGTSTRDENIVKAYYEDRIYKVYLCITDESPFNVITSHKFNEEVTWANFERIEGQGYDIDLNSIATTLIKRLLAHNGRRDSQREWIKYNGTPYEVLVAVKRVRDDTPWVYELE